MGVPRSFGFVASLNLWRIVAELYHLTPGGVVGPLLYFSSGHDSELGLGISELGFMARAGITSARLSNYEADCLATRYLSMIR